MALVEYVSMFILVLPWEEGEQRMLSTADRIFSQGQFCLEHMSYNLHCYAFSLISYCTGWANTSQLHTSEMHSVKARLETGRFTKPSREQNWSKKECRRNNRVLKVQCVWDSLFFSSYMAFLASIGGDSWLQQFTDTKTDFQQQVEK